ncbi:ribosome maturation factor RimM [Sphaerisporangium siamense]|uniref:Ribosome maturation factor RimM n=1 Tax=Sphaerisporangium siamense TaxID=795645 RepID=A0A7W7DES7_9ACTN|nr:ribosome maturation factor RimM [Sphaerisporangium siamense]MBB4705540.1 16S rRNA processing protein RimM [Sphaerisporangium siamense]GII83080.1 ribosome maturation factor RimM [Sphaerisporangium siamense]
MQLVVGRIGRPHGVRGEVTVEVRTDEPETRFAPGTSIATDPASRGPLVVETMRWHKNILLLGFEGVAGRDGAEDLRGTMLVIDSGDIPVPEDPDEFYDHQLIGLAVVTVAGEPVGEITDVLHHGQDLLVVRRGSGEVLIPFVKNMVPEIDLPGGRAVVDVPPGLLDLNEAG